MARRHSPSASDDHRSLTAKREATVEKAIETNRVRPRSAFSTLTADELTTLVERVRQDFG
jgi:hypothetical protein